MQARSHPAPARPPNRKGRAAPNFRRRPHPCRRVRHRRLPMPENGACNRAVPKNRHLSPGAAEADRPFNHPPSNLPCRPGRRDLPRTAIRGATIRDRSHGRRLRRATPSAGSGQALDTGSRCGRPVRHILCVLEKAGGRSVRFFGIFSPIHSPANRFGRKNGNRVDQAEMAENRALRPGRRGNAAVRSY